ncbi:MAG: hypothetical protein K6G18_05915 [Treponema sp.]|nr:hypothetical protein [Treponema sp.]
MEEEKKEFAEVRIILDKNGRLELAMKGSGLSIPASWIYINDAAIRKIAGAIGEDPAVVEKKFHKAMKKALLHEAQHEAEEE